MESYAKLNRRVVFTSVYFDFYFAYTHPMNKFRELISSDIPFARDDAHRLLPAMIACLTGFAALLLALAMCLTSALSTQSNDVIGMLQIEVPRAKANDTSYIENVTTTLEKTAGVETVTPISQSQMEKLLKPWLGDDFEIADLPVPMIFDVKTAVKGDETAVNLASLRSALNKIDTNIRVEDRGPWVSHMVRAVGLLQALVLIVAMLLILCVLGMIVLVARTNLRLHFKTVSLLHMFGATDEYILRQFQWNNAWLTARGAFTGVALAALIYIGAMIASSHFASPVIPAISISPMQVLMFLVLPIFTAMIALVATRLTVQSMLENMH
jgi:cell division transport system permease protein